MDKKLLAILVLATLFLVLIFIMPQAEEIKPSPEPTKIPPLANQEKKGLYFSFSKNRTNNRKS